MNDIVRDAIAADLATLERLVDAPEPPLGYGRDLACVTEISPTLEQTDPESPRGIAEGLARRLITPRGTLPDDAEYGLDLRRYVNRGTPLAELEDLAGAIRQEAGKDDRVDRVSAAVELVDRGLRVSVRVTPFAIGSKDFAFVLSVTSSAVLIEAIQ